MKINVTMLIIILCSTISVLHAKDDERRKGPPELKSKYLSISLFTTQWKVMIRWIFLGVVDNRQNLKWDLKLVSLTIKLLKYNNIYLIVANLGGDFYKSRDVKNLGKKIICGL